VRDLARRAGGTALPHRLVLTEDAVSAQGLTYKGLVRS
jgi:hypothetical protein